MSNCPACGKPILNCGDFGAPARFRIRCPWCKSILQVTVRMKITVDAVQLEPLFQETGERKIP